MKYYLNKVQKSLKKRQYFYFIFIMLMASTFLPISDNVRFITHHLGWSGICFISLVIFKPQIFQNRMMMFTLLYSIIFMILINTIWVNVDDGNKRLITEETRELLLAMAVLTYFRIEQDYFNFGKLVKWTLIFMFITAVMTILTSYIDPLFVRNLTNVSAINSRNVLETLSRYKKLGGGNYSFASSLICLFPMLIYYYKNNVKSILKKQYLLLCTVIFLFAVIRTQIFANIIISLFVIALSVLGSKNIKASIFISLIAIVAILIVPLEFYSHLLAQMSKWFPGESNISYKLNEMSKFIIFGDQNQTTVSSHAARYPLLLKPFLANPLLGHFISKPSTDIIAGIHLHWMNKLAVYGLLGTIPFLFIIYGFIRECIKYFDKEFTYYFFLSVCSIIVLGLMKTLSGAPTWYTFFILIPGYYYLQMLKSNEQTILISPHYIAPGHLTLKV